MPLRVQLLCFFPLASTWESNTQFFLEWKQVVFPSLNIYIGKFLMRVGGGVSCCVWQTLFVFDIPFCFHISNIKGLLFNCLIAKLIWSTIPFSLNICCMKTDLHGPRWNSKLTYMLRLLVSIFHFCLFFFFLSFCCSVKCMSYQNQSGSINKVQNLRKKEGKYPRFRLQQFFLSKICREIF